MACHCTTPATSHEFLTNNLYTWCTNCGNYGIFGAVRRALAAQNLHPCQVAMAFDIGCNGNGSDKILGYRIHGLHGRVLPLASGMAVANPKVPLLAFAGDGATFAEGVGHFVSAIRGNYNMTFMLHNNLNYGLTTGQASPTTKEGMKMNSSPDGITSESIHPLRFAMALRPSFVARTFSGDVTHMTQIIQAGMEHKGFSFIEILQSCPTYNKATPHEWYQERVYDITTRPGYDPSNLAMAIETVEDIENHIALGVIYQDKARPDFMARLENRQGKTTSLVEEVAPFDVSALAQKFC